MSHAADPAMKCESGKLKEVGKYANCRLKAHATGVSKNTTPDFTKCEEKFTPKYNGLETKAGAGICLTEADEPSINALIVSEAADIAILLGGGSVCGNASVEGAEQCEGSQLGGATCVTQGFLGGTLSCASDCTLDTSGCYAARFVDNGDGTVTDMQTGLQWEKKTTTLGSGVNYSDPHDVDNSYYLFTNTSWDYMLFSFLNLLNQSFSTDGSMAAAGWTTCFARRCDWRVPTITELRSIVDVTVPGCGTGSPCIDPVLGPTVADGQNGSKYLSWTQPPATEGPFTVTGLWNVDFKTGTAVAVDPFIFPYRVRAVRGGRDSTWVTGNWSACSATCGGGTQTRTVTCQSPLGEFLIATETACVGAGPKPATQQSCNTDPC